MIYILKKKSSVCTVCGLHGLRFSMTVSQTSFGGETSGSIAKCRLFSQANKHRNMKSWGKKKEKETVKVSRNKEKRYTKLCLQKQK